MGRRSSKSHSWTTSSSSRSSNSGPPVCSSSSWCLSSSTSSFCVEKSCSPASTTADGSYDGDVDDVHGELRQFNEFNATNIHDDAEPRYSWISSIHAYDDDADDEW